MKKFVIIIFVIIGIILVSFILINTYEDEKNTSFKVELNLVCEANGDFSKLRTDYNDKMKKEGKDVRLKEDVRWFYQATNEKRFKELQQYFGFESTPVSFEDKYVLISIGSPIDSLTCNENHKYTWHTKSGEEYYEYLITPIFDENIYEEGKIYVYTMGEILLTSIDFGWLNEDLSEDKGTVWGEPLK